MRHVSEATLAKYRGPGRCALCHSWAQNLEVAHVIARGQGGGRRLDIDLNLLALGPAWSCLCHYKAHHAAIAPRVLFEAVARREGLDPAFVERQLWALARAPKEMKVCGPCQGSGSVRVDHSWGFRRGPCVCGGVGILDRFGEPYREAERKLAGT